MMNTRLLFSDTAGGESISFDQLCLRIKSHLTASGITMEDFENRVGFGIGPSVTKPGQPYFVLDCSFRLLRNGVNWLQALKPSRT